ncbi:phenylacetyl-CoA ligase pclA-Penicillium chrysogenum [Penicillium paradoxum]|uniref:phenylacetyl-CoA ligase pclA-Penicillium chrysogenum n=1 Tax=Penicillium paradoxum TaxID=176176 RepID=UPI002547C22A|nr:phenylacetyl-CoA ligase pclA-Penicillium chrysogenum [Penicillium paradoxum]KAJ5794632.1 phenylacetyl-CoA ligase pclA-Penicillium chrysogenum [Penicillium paradoxum]
MVFLPAKDAGQLAPIPDNISISEFMLNEKHGRRPHANSQDPYTCGFTGKSYSSQEVATRVDFLARSLSKEFGWAPNEGSEWDKTLAVFTVNTIDSLPLFWAVHRLGGVLSPANASYSAAELTHQLLDSKAKALVTCAPLLSISLEAAAKAGLPKSKIYLIDVPKVILGGAKPPTGHKSVSELLEAGKSLPPVEELKWSAGEGTRRTAFLCYSSGTSGLPKGVMISHRNVIANVLQIKAHEESYRTAGGTKPPSTEVALGLLPQSHIYALVVIAHAGAYRGDQTIVLPKFELKSYLNAIQSFKITGLFLVPPIIIHMLSTQDVCSKYDLGSVKTLFTGAAPLGVETAADFLKLYPNVVIRQGYGLTETSTVVSSTHPHDVFLGSSGALVPGFEARIVTPENEEITTYDTPGELVVRGPSVVLGYLNNEKATKETFVDGWMRTGDEAVIRVSPKGIEHVFIVDRIKELIKVKGHQVAPAELEAHLLAHPDVADCAVVAIPDDRAGEVPKAIVVKSPTAGSDESVSQALVKYVEEHKARHKWLKGGIRFVDAIPKSPSGKILRRLIRDQEKEARRKAGSKI